MNSLRKRLAIVCPSCGGGGSVAGVALHQAQGLARGFHVDVISESFPSDLPEDVGKVTIRPKAFVWLRRFGHVPREIAFALAARRALTELRRAGGLDFVLCHGHTVAALAAARLQARFDVPFGLVTHGDIFDRPKGTYDPWLTWFYQCVTPTAYRRADLVVALSPHMEQLALRGGAADQRVRLIPNGIDALDAGLAGPPELHAPASGEPIRILFVGRLSIEKGVDILLRACARLAGKDLRFALRVVGDGGLRTDLEQMARSLGISKQTRFLGTMRRADLGVEYAACHVVCVPSRSDPLPTVALEALAAGRPVVGTKVGGIPFAVRHEESGLLVAPEDDGELTDAFERLMGDSRLLVAMGQHAYEEAQRRFSWDHVIQQLSAAVSDTINHAVQAPATG